MHRSGHQHASINQPDMLNVPQHCATSTAHVCPSVSCSTDSASIVGCGCAKGMTYACMDAMQRSKRQLCSSSCVTRRWSRLLLPLQPSRKQQQPMQQLRQQKQQRKLQLHRQLAHSKTGSSSCSSSLCGRPGWLEEQQVRSGNWFGYPAGICARGMGQNLPDILDVCFGWAFSGRLGAVVPPGRDCSACGSNFGASPFAQTRWSNWYVSCAFVLLEAIGQ